MIKEIYLFAHWCEGFSPFKIPEYLTKFPDGDVSESRLGEIQFGPLKKGEWERFKFFALDKLSKNFDKICLFGDSNYPKKFLRLFHPPPLFFYRGDLSLVDEKSVGIVGAREPTDSGRKWVQACTEELSRKNTVIVSGGARGIDFEAHHGALKNSGRTIAFLPSGLDEPYPRSNHETFKKIGEKGLLISEFLPGTNVNRWHFQQRNRLIVGASDAVVIVEAGERSGTLMTANIALRENVDLMVVPGSPMVASYAGSLSLLKDGAGLARHAQDVVDVIDF